MMKNKKKYIQRFGSVPMIFVVIACFCWLFLIPEEKTTDNGAVIAEESRTTVYVQAGLNPNEYHILRSDEEAAAETATDADRQEKMETTTIAETMTETKRAEEKETEEQSQTEGQPQTEEQIQTDIGTEIQAQTDADTEQQTGEQMAEIQTGTPTEENIQPEHIEESEEMQAGVVYEIPASYEIPTDSGTAYRTYRGFKCVESYCALNSKDSPQYILQQEAVTAGNGLRMVNDRYCVAIGSYFGTEIGQYFDLVLENGTIIPCIKGDEKADIHTDPENIFTMASGCCSEFIVDYERIPFYCRYTGNASFFYENWDSPVEKLIVYPIGIFP